YRYTKRLTNDHDQRYDLAVIVGYLGTIHLPLPSTMVAAADLQALVQRLQKLSEDQFKEEDTNVFLVTCQLCLEEEQLEVLFEIIKDEKNLFFMQFSLQSLFVF
ncbi:unnamed protein product, partial [Ranitomeya imitator]